MKFNRVLVVYKQIERVGKRGTRQGHPTAAGMTAHLRTLDELYEILKQLGWGFTAVPLRQLRTVGDVDLVITVGGDGTVLATSHFVHRQPILGVKSFGLHSVGYFCATTRESLGLYLRGMADRLRRPRRLHRLEAHIDGHLLKETILNDVLFAHASPAALTTYRLTVGRHTEVQRSSGLWICTAAGSTAAVAAAGGRSLPLHSAQIEYLVREPYAPSRPYRLLRGVLAPAARSARGTWAGSETPTPGAAERLIRGASGADPRTTLRVESLTPQGTLSIDGAGIQYPAPEGAQLLIRRSQWPLWIYWR